MAKEQIVREFRKNWSTVKRSLNNKNPKYTLVPIVDYEDRVLLEKITLYKYKVRKVMKLGKPYQSTKQYKKKSLRVIF